LDQLSSFEVSMTHLNQCLLLNIEKAQQCQIQELNPSILFYLHQGRMRNEHEYVTKMAQSVTMGGLWGDFISTKYLQMPIYVRNKI
jgi:predicted nucleotidyltransferase